jgi:hypothetical protein
MGTACTGHGDSRPQLATSDSAGDKDISSNRDQSTSVKRSVVDLVAAGRRHQGGLRWQFADSFGYVHRLWTTTSQ